MTKKRTNETVAPEAPDFQEVVNLLAVFSEATSRLAEIEATANAQLLELIDDHKAEYSKLQEACRKAEAALEVICRSHPEWFKSAKTIKTPYGSVSFRTGTSLAVTNDEATVKLLRAEEERTRTQRHLDAQTPVFDAKQFIRMVELPNLEALEKLDDSTLAKFMVKRVSADSFTAKGAKVDFGKAVKEAIDTKAAEKPENN